MSLYSTGVLLEKCPKSATCFGKLPGELEMGRKSFFETGILGFWRAARLDGALKGRRGNCRIAPTPDGLRGTLSFSTFGLTFGFFLAQLSLTFSPELQNLLPLGPPPLNFRPLACPLRFDFLFLSLIVPDAFPRFRAAQRLYDRQAEFPVAAHIHFATRAITTAPIRNRSPSSPAHASRFSPSTPIIPHQILYCGQPIPMIHI